MSFIIENGILKPETNIIIPDGVTRIGDHAFEKRIHLQSIEIPDSVISIGDYAFCDCESLQSIKIPDSVTSIGCSAFSGCHILQSIKIPGSVTRIEERTFAHCGLFSLLSRKIITTTIPASVTYIGYGGIPEGRITFRSKDFQVSFRLYRMYGINRDEKRLAIFYNDPTYNNFKKIKQTCYKNPMALLRYFGHNEDEYSDYIKENISEIVSGLIDENNCQLINMILTTDFITKNSVDELINHSVEMKQIEMTALLLDYKNKHFGFTDINKRFRI